MKKLILLLFISVMATSCLTVGKIQKNCDKFAAICVTETIIETVYRDTTIYVDRIIEVQLPQDTVTITDTVTIINNMAYLSPVTKRFGLIGVNAGVKASILNVRAWLTDSTILVPVHDTIFLDNVISDTNTNNTVTVVEKFIPKFYKFTFWLFILAVLGGIIYGIFWLKGNAIKNVINKLKK